MVNKIEKLSHMINECKNIVFFGGAGVSTESGVKDYRSTDGLYNTVKEYGVAPEVILSRSFFFDNTEVFYDFYRKYFVADVVPNMAHKALAELEKYGKLKAVITQNIDSLHQKAGSTNVIELHGNAGKFECPACMHIPSSDAVTKDIKKGILPRCEVCNTVIKPKVVLYEEPLYPGITEKSIEYIQNADMLIVGGTSLAVYPAASFVEYFSGKYIVIINKSETSFDKNADLIINDSIGKVMEEVMKLI